MDQRDYYQLLGVAPEATERQIKEAYRKLAFQYHPDRTADRPESAEMMKAVNEAYAVLSNPAKRREYDALRQQFGGSAAGRFRQTYSQQDIFSGSDIQQIFEEMARSFGLRGFDEIFKEFYGQGQGVHSFRFDRPGVSGRGLFVFGGFGRPSGSPRRALAGNLGRLSRALLEKVSGVQLPQGGADIIDTVQLTPEYALSGGPYAFYHRRRDKKLIVKIPAGVRDGQKIRLAGLGLPGRGGAPDGDLYLRIRVKTPFLKRIRQGIAPLLGR